MQHLGAGPLTALLPEGTEIWLDGAHNIDAGLALARQFKGEPRRIHLITGMLAHKDPAAVIAPLADRLASLTVVLVPGHDHHGAAAFRSESRRGGTECVSIGRDRWSAYPSTNTPYNKKN